MKQLTVSIVSLVVALFFSLTTASAAFAQNAPFQLSLTPDIAVHNRDVMIEGVTIGIWSENPQKALALGIVSGSTGESVGFSWSWLLNYADSYKGIHWALVNYTKGNFLGWQHGAINYTDQRLKGVQTGWINYARDFKGVQLGLVNFAETADTGVQLGLVNIIRENQWFSEFPDALAPGMIFLNWRF